MDAGELQNISDMIRFATRISADCFDAAGDIEQAAFVRRHAESLQKDRESHPLTTTGQKPTCT